MRTHGILLAAGAGRRLGSPKALVAAPDGTPWVVIGVRRLLAAGCARVTVVVGAEAEQVRRVLAEGIGDDSRVWVRVATDWAEGMGRSLRWGLTTIDPAADAVLITLVDLPDVPHLVHERVLDRVRSSSAARRAIVRATYEGRQGHPVVIGADHVGPLLQHLATQTDADRGARDWLATQVVDLVECGMWADGDDIDDERELRARGGRRMTVRTPDELKGALGDHGYLADTPLATTAWLALAMDRPLFCEGVPGVGKTALASAMAQVLGGPLVRLQCYEGIEAHQALYDWDFPRQLLHVRAREGDAAAERDLWGEDYLVERPVLKALRASRPGARAVLLIDEIDRADDEFEALLLEVLADWAITIPEFGRVVAETPPLVVITSNRTRDVHDALKRRCLYHFVDLPDRERERAIVRTHVPGASDGLTGQVLDAVARLREMALLKPPGVAESIDWVRALAMLGVDGLDGHVAAATLGAAVKHADDLAAARELIVGPGGVL